MEDGFYACMLRLLITTIWIKDRLCIPNSGYIFMFDGFRAPVNESNGFPLSEKDYFLKYI